MLRRAACAVLFLGVGFAQSQSEGPRFEVVSIKPVPRPTPGDGAPFGLNVDGARVQINNYRLIDVLTRAFRVALPQVDAPDFTRDEFFEIQAALPAGAKPEQVPEMLQAMLAERFKLAYHRETRQYQMNVLTVGKSGMKLARLPDGTQASSTYNRLADGTLRWTLTGKVPSLFPGVAGYFDGLPMVDETGLDGIYSWVRDQAQTAPGGGFEAYKAVVQDSFRAMLEAAGLKLETRKVPKETIVVDHLEKNPTEN